jgi:hypothetical protein
MEGKMDKNWKAFERRVAKKCGGTRISVSDRKTDLDVDHPQMGIECKYRNKLPQYLKDWYSQAERGSTEDQIPVVVMTEKSNSKMYALINFDDLADMVAILSYYDEKELKEEVNKEDFNYGGTG